MSDPITTAEGASQAAPPKVCAVPATTVLPQVRDPGGWPPSTRAS
ncbi:hypothetical protein [Streptomyces kronopolitis]